MAERQRISSGGPWEAVAGYSRAIVVGDGCWVAGTTDAGADGQSQHPGDVVGQTRAVLGIIEAALGEAGFALTDVVRTRMFVTDISSSGPCPRCPRRAVRRDPTGGHHGRSQCADGPESADRDRSRGAARLTAVGVRASRQDQALARSPRSRPPRRARPAGCVCGQRSRDRRIRRPTRCRRGSSALRRRSP